MAEQQKELTKLLVIVGGRDGRWRFDKASKQELVETCLQPGVSIAAMAQANGVNANLLHKWIREYRNRNALPVGKRTVVIQSKAEEPAFVPVIEMKRPARLSSLGLCAELPNGIKLEFIGLASNELPTLLQTLSILPCSG
jgi:transposase